MVDGADRTDRTDGADENRGIDEKQCAWKWVYMSVKERKFTYEKQHEL